MNRFKTQGYSMPKDEPRVKTCPDCDGEGGFAVSTNPNEENTWEHCETCKGEGVIIIDEEE